MAAIYLNSLACYKVSSLRPESLRVAGRTAFTTRSLTERSSDKKHGQRFVCCAEGGKDNREDSEDVQNALVDILNLQIEYQKVKDTVSEESAKLEETAEKVHHWKVVLCESGKSFPRPRSPGKHHFTFYTDTIRKIEFE